MTPWRRLAATVLVVALVPGAGAGLVGCASDDGSEDPQVQRSEAGYTPVPDQELFAEVAALPGVTSADVRWTDSFGNSNVYAGTVRVTRSADPEAVLDRVHAILRQGRPGATLGVTVRQPGAPDTTAAQLGLYTAADVEERYGPQPGDGRPPVAD